MESLNQICAVVDVQGFATKSHFYPRELSVIGKNIEVNMEFDTRQNAKYLPYAEQKTIHYQTQKIHGLTLRPSYEARAGLKHANRLRRVLWRIYKSVVTEDKPYFGCKNQQLAEILEEEGIPFIDLDSVAPRLRDLDKLNGGCAWLCKYHTVTWAPHLTCAER